MNSKWLSFSIYIGSSECLFFHCFLKEQRVVKYTYLLDLSNKALKIHFGQGAADMQVLKVRHAGYRMQIAQFRQVKLGTFNLQF